MEVINLNLIPSGANPVAHAAQFDVGRATRFNLLEGATPYTLDGTETLTVSVRKNDGHIVTEAVTNTSDSYVEVITTEQMTACAGENLATIKITKGGDTIATLNYILMVQKDPEDGGDPSESFIHDLSQQIADAVSEQYAAEDVVFDNAPTAGHGTGFAVTSEGVKNAIDGAIAGLTIPEELDDLQDVELTSPTAGQILEYDDGDGKWKNVANPASTTNFGAPYDENTTYNVPSLVIYNNLLYKLNEGEDGTTGPWDPTKWTQTSVAELAALIGSLSQLTTTDKSSLVGAVNEVNARATYSTSETVVGKWTDGRAVYQRVFDGLNITTTADTWVDTGVARGEVKKIIDGFALDAEQSFVCAFGFSAGNILINMPIARSALNSIIIRYVKAT